MKTAKRILTIVLVVLLAGTSMPRISEYHANAAVIPAQKVIYVLNTGANMTDTAYIDPQSTNTSTLEAPPWGGDPTYRIITGSNSITYKVDLPDNSYNVYINAYGGANGKVEISRDKNEWVASHYSGNTVFNYIPLNQSFLEDNATKTIYIRVSKTDGNSYFYGSFLVTYNVFGPEPVSASATNLSATFNAGTVEESGRLYETTGGNASVSGSQWNIWGGGYATFRFDLPDNTTSFTVGAYCWPKAKVSVSTDNTSWTTTFNGPANGTTQFATSNNGNFLSSNPSKVIYIRVETNDVMAMTSINYAATLSGPIPAITDKNISFAPTSSASVTDEPFYMHSQMGTENFYWTDFGANVRRINGNGRIVYRFNFENNTSSASLVFEVKYQYKISVSINGSRWTLLESNENLLVDDPENGYKKTTIDLTAYLQENYNKVLYLKCENAVPDATTGSYITRLAINYTLSGEDSPDKIETTHLISFAPTATDHPTAEYDYLYDQSSTYNYFWGDLNANVRRISVVNGYVVYKFNLENNATIATLIYDVKYQYKLSVSKNGTDWTVIGSENNLAIGDPGGHAKKVIIDLTEFLENNHNKTIYIKCENEGSTNPDPAAIVNIALQYTLLYDDFPDDPEGNPVRNISFHPNYLDESNQILLNNNTSTFLISIAEGFGRQINVGGSILYHFNMDNNAKSAKLVFEAKNQYKISMSNDGVNWNVLDMGVNLKETDTVNHKRKIEMDITSYLKNNYNKMVFLKCENASDDLSDLSILVNVKISYTYEGSDYPDDPTLYTGAGPNNLIDANGYNYFFIPIGDEQESAYISHVTNGKGSYLEDLPETTMRIAEYDDTVTYRIPFPNTTTIARLVMDLACEYSVSVSRDGISWESLLQSVLKTRNHTKITRETLNLSAYLTDNPSKIIYVRFSDPTPEDGWGSVINNIMVGYKYDGTLPGMDEIRQPTKAAPDPKKEQGRGILFAPGSSYEKKYLLEEKDNTLFDYFGETCRAINSEAYCIYKFDLENNANSATFVTKVFGQYRFSVSTDGEYWIEIASEAEMFKDINGLYADYFEFDISDFLYENDKKILYVKCEDFTPFDDHGNHMLAVGLEYTVKGYLGNINTINNPETSEVLPDVWFPGLLGIMCSILVVLWRKRVHGGRV